MGWTDDEIDNLAKNASMHQKVEYSDTYWKEMEGLLDADKPVKKRFGWWFFGATISLLLIGIGFYYGNQNIGSKKETILAHNVPYINKSEQTKSVLKRDNNFFIHNQEQIEMKQSNPTTTKEINVLEDKSFSSFYEESKLKPVKISSLNTRVLSEPNDEEQIEQKVGTKGQTELTAFAVKNIISDFEPEKSFRADNQEINEKNPEISHVELTENNAVHNMVEDPTSPKKLGFYVSAGAGAGTSYVKTSSELLIQWRVNMGIDYTISREFRFGAGVGFRQQIANNLTVERSREYYSFGLIDVNQSINYDRLQFVDLNIHAHYLLRKMAIGIEITPSYLVSVRANMKQTQTEYDNSFVDEVITKKLENQFVRSNNFNAFGLDAGISFQYQFKYKMSLQAVASTRLNKMLMNNDFRGQHNGFPVKLELGLIKRF